MLGLKGIAITGAIGAIVCGILYVMLTNARADAVQAQAALLDTKRVLASTQAQNIALQQDVVDARADASRARAETVLANDTSADLADKNAALQNRLTQEVENVANQDDGPAAPVLEYAANGLRQYAQDIAALRTRDHHEGETDAGADSGQLSPGLPAARGSWPTRQRDFAALALKWGGYALACAKDRPALADWQTGYNKLQTEGAP